MKPTPILLLVAVPALLNAQVTVKGIVTEQNSGNRPLSGVQVKVLGSTPDRTGRDGLFQLVFTAKQPGDRIVVSGITKKGYEIVNKEMVNNWVILKNSDARFRVVMCPEGTIAKNTLKFYNISLDGLTRGYKKRIRELQAERDRARIDAKTFAEQAARLAVQFENQQKQLEALSEKFARENFDDCSEIHRKAFEAFKAGNIGEALQLLELVDSGAEIEKARIQRGKAEGIISEGTRMLLQSDTIIRQHIAKLKFQSDLYITELRFEEALKARETAVKADTTDPANVYEYAVFLQKQTLYAESEHWFRLALSLATDNFDRSCILLDLGNTDIALHAYEQAEREFLEGFEIRRAMTPEDHAEYILNLTDAAFGLAEFYFDVHQFGRMDSLIGEMLVLLEEVRKTHPEESRMWVALFKGSLGNLYAEQGRKQEAINLYSEAVDLMQQHGRPAEEPDLSNLATVLNSLGTLQSDVQLFKAGEANVLESLDIGRELAGKNPQRYNRELAVTLFNCAKFYIHFNQPARAEQYIQESVQFLTALYDRYPVIYSHDLAKILAMRAQILQRHREYEKAEPDYLEATRILRELSAMNPEVYMPDLAKILQVFGYFKTIRNQFDQAEVYLTESIQIFNDLEDSNEEVYYPLVARSLHFLARLYVSQELHEKAKDFEKQTLTAFRELDAKYPNTYQYDIARVLVDLSATCCLLNEKDEARAAIEEFRRILQGLITKSPVEYTLMLADLLGRYASFCYKNDLEDAMAKAAEALGLYGQFNDTVLARQSMASQCLRMMSKYMILSEEFTGAEKYALRALELDPGAPWIREYLAHSYLFQGKYDEARKIYLELKDQPAPDATKTYRDLFLDDFDEFGKSGVTHPDVEKIRKLLAD